MPIIDIDTHYTEPRDLWTSRAPAKYKDKVHETLGGYSADVQRKVLFENAARLYRIELPQTH